MEMKGSKHGLGVLLVCFSAILWGLDGVVLTPRLYNLDINYVVFMLHFLPFLGMNIFFYKEYSQLKSMSGEDIFYFFLIALFGGALGTLSIVKALFLVHFKALTVVALLQKLQPVFTIVLARILLKEKIGKNFVLWSAVALMGGYFLTFELKIPVLEESGNMLEASIYAVLAAFSFGSSTVFGKKVLSKVSYRTALFYRYALTTIIMLAIVVQRGSLGYFYKTTANNWLIFIVIGLTTGSGAIMLYYYALRYVRANVATICELCFPISSIIFDYVFNGNILSPVQWISAAFMIFAIYRIGKNQSVEQIKGSLYLNEV